MFRGEEYLRGNPEIVQTALKHYIKKLEQVLKPNPINPITLPDIFEQDIPTIKKRIEGLCQSLEIRDLNEIRKLDQFVELVSSALRIYRKDLEKCKEKMNKEFYDEIPTNTTLDKEIRKIGDAFERISKL